MNEIDLITTHYFHNFIETNDTFFDSLMATSAAPTFFEAYNVKGIGKFLDGGIHCNNPAFAAYT